MVKLLRLTSRSGDGVFKNNLQNNLILKPNSSIALLNLTFNTTLTSLFVDGDNNQISFSGSIFQNLGNLGWQQPYIDEELEGGEYYSDNLRFAQLLVKVQNTLNRTLDAIPTQSRLYPYPWNTVYSEFYIPIYPNDPGYGETVQINFRFCVLVTPLGGQGPAQIPADPFEETLTTNEPMWSQSQTLDNNGGGVDNFDTSIADNTIQLKTGLGNGIPSSTRHRFFTDTKHIMARGAGIYFVRIKLLTDNGSGLENNGFGIGLSTVDMSTGVNFDPEDDLVDINPLDRQFEIICNRPAEPYEVIVNGGRQNPNTQGITPQRTAANQAIQDHDIIWFQINKGVLRGGVWYDAGATGEERVFFEHTLTSYQASSGFYPYLYCRGAAANCQISAINYSVSSFIPGNADYEQTGQNSSWDLLNLLLSGSTPSAIGQKVPLLNPYRFRLYYEPEVDFEVASLKMNADIWSMLGFSRYAFSNEPDGTTVAQRTINAGVGDQDGWVQWTGDRATDARALSDNFMVVVDDLNLDSYDASRSIYNKNVIITNTAAPNMGRRKNILMTIPVNNNTTDTVEFDTNTPIYIDLLNDQPRNLRNIDLRILNKRFNPVDTVGESVMTILIDNE